MFLLDGSDDTHAAFPVMRKFVQRVVEAFDVGEDKTRVAVVQYSSDQQTHFNLNTYTGKQDVLEAMQQIRHKGGRNLNTGAALNYVRTNTFADSSGSRRQEGVPQILILLSGQRSQDDVARAALALKQDKVVSFVVGPRNADILEQQMIADHPSYAFLVPQYNDFENIYQQLVSFVKKVPRQQPRLTPQYGQGKSVCPFICPSTYLPTYLLTNLPTFLSTCVRQSFYCCHFTLCYLSAEHHFLLTFLQIKLNPLRMTLYFYWIHQKKCKMILEQCLALSREQWKSSKWLRTKTESQWCSTAESLLLNFF